MTFDEEVSRLKTLSSLLSKGHRWDSIGLFLDHIKEDDKNGKGGWRASINGNSPLYYSQREEERTLRGTIEEAVSDLLKIAELEFEKEIIAAQNRLSYLQNFQRNK